MNNTAVGESLLRTLAVLTVAAAVALAATAATLASCGTDSPDPPDDDDREPADVRLIAASDVHGHLAPSTGQVTTEDEEDIVVGGAAYMAAVVDELRDGQQHSTFLHAGDLIGDSSDISRLFYEETTVEVFNAMGLDIAAVGNHEFGRGVDELMRLKDGGEPAGDYGDDRSLSGMNFELLAANVTWRDSDESIAPPYHIGEYGDVRIGYVGMTLEQTPDHVAERTVEDIEFHGEVETMQHILPELHDEGVDVVIAVIHQGGRPDAEPQHIADCADVDGPIVDIAEQMPDDVDIIISGHTHRPYICEFSDMLVTQADNSSRVITSIDLHVDPVEGGLVDAEANQHPVRNDIAPHEEIEEMVDEYTELRDELRNREIGELTGDAPRSDEDDAVPSPMGRLVADAMREATDADVAFVAPGCVDAGLDAGTITYNKLLYAQPFNDPLVTVTLTGEQLRALLNQQWQTDGDDVKVRQLNVSQGFSYRFDPDADIDYRVVSDSLQLHGEPIDPDEPYSVTVNDFLADGGHGFDLLEDGSERSEGPRDLDALIDYLQTNSPLQPPDSSRARPIEK